jgi:hypothetical protein
MTFPVELPARYHADEVDAVAVGQRLHPGAGRARVTYPSAICRLTARSTPHQDWQGQAGGRQPARSGAKCWMWWPTVFAWATPSSARVLEAMEVALKRGGGRLNVYVLNGASGGG